jgi:hypothetical protein
MNNDNLYTLIPLEDFKAVLGVDDRESQPAEPGFAFAGPGDLSYGVVLRLLALRHVTFIHLHTHWFACLYWAGRFFYGVVLYLLTIRRVTFIYLLPNKCF